MLHHILNFGFLAKHSQSHALINLAALFKVDMKRKFLFSHMKVHEKQERTLLTVSDNLSGSRDTQNWFTANNATVKIMTSSGLHVDH